MKYFFNNCFNNEIYLKFLTHNKFLSFPIQNIEQHIETPNTMYYNQEYIVRYSRVNVTIQVTDNRTNMNAYINDLYSYQNVFGIVSGKYLIISYKKFKNFYSLHLTSSQRNVFNDNILNFSYEYFR